MFINLLCDSKSLNKKKRDEFASKHIFHSGKQCLAERIFLVEWLYHQEKFAKVISYNIQQFSSSLSLIQDGQIGRLEISPFDVSKQKSGFFVFYIGSQAFFSVSTREFIRFTFLHKSLIFKESLTARFWVSKSLIAPSLQFFTHCSLIIGGHKAICGSLILEDLQTFCLHIPQFVKWNFTLSRVLPSIPQFYSLIWVHWNITWDIRMAVENHFRPNFSKCLTSLFKFFLSRAHLGFTFSAKMFPKMAMMEY